MVLFDTYLPLAKLARLFGYFNPERGPQAVNIYQITKGPAHAKGLTAGEKKRNEMEQSFMEGLSNSFSSGLEIQFHY